MQSQSVSDVEPDQEMTAPGNSIFSELAGTDEPAPEIPVPVTRSSGSKMSKGREPTRTSELYIGGLEEMKVWTAIES